jgi:aspartyl-tRNA(Asn)/glutamyl-tRNA(Gln) amidotransferase subunit C
MRYKHAMAESPISREQVLHVARLARLTLDDAEVERMTQELGAILSYVELLNEAPIANVPPTSQVGVEALPLQQDTCHVSLDHGVVLQESAKSGHDGFVVPAFIDE